MKHICLFTSMLNIVYDGRTINEANALISAGYKVTIAANYPRPTTTDTIQDNSRYNIVYLHDIHRPKWTEHAPSVIRKFFSLLYLLYIFLTSLWRTLRISADVYHAPDYNSLLLAYMASILKKSKVVYDSRDFYAGYSFKNGKPIYRNVTEYIEGLIIKKVDVVITSNDSMGEAMSKHYKIPIPMIIRACKSFAYDVTTKKNVRDDIGLEAMDKLIVHTGSITVPSRGLCELVTAISKIPEIHFAFVGWGPSVEKLKMLSKNLNVQHRVHFLKPVPYEMITQYISSADAGIASIKPISKQYLYTLPSKFFEYIAAGLPVLASDQLEMKNIIENYRIGETFNPYEPDSIVHSILELFDESKYPLFKENVLIARQELNWEKESKKLLSVYERI
ncbi:glycosyltransferase [Dehalococcoidia bacterium]|nr:glycosyltransferase [Dehalococcoidia bacterium]